MRLDRPRWTELSTRLGCPALAARFPEVEAAYGEPHRSYHTGRHIAECLDAFDRVVHLADEPDELEMAIWLHDLVYRTLRGGSEEASAERASAWLDEAGAAKATRSAVHRLILITRHPSSPSTVDEQLMIDIDLNVLGAPESRYDEYEAQIREEFKAVPAILFKRKRAQLLETFLEPGPIYHTEWFRERLEEQARSNLRRAIARLRS